MRKKEVKRLLKQHPEFEAWLLQDSSRISAIRANPAAAGDWFKRWNERKNRVPIDFDSLTQKTKRANDMLTNVQSIMEMMADYNKKRME
ncbi:hypothetical protein [Brevibacillus sp. H7]|jgi:hypothetical protein|uniref:hypothetical protein n=1 Tax=Brevibacillus sp. H7 TaxID=3349138 RepID=UPI0037F12162